LLGGHSEVVDFDVDAGVAHDRVDVLELAGRLAAPLSAYLTPLAVNVTRCGASHINTPSLTVNGHGPSVQVACETKPAGCGGGSEIPSHPATASIVAATVNPARIGLTDKQ
jgi:hypothetical protein